MGGGRGCYRCLLWIAMILWVAAQPKTSFFPSEVKTFLGMPREWLQYPYHFGVFFILAFLFRRCLSGPVNRLDGYKTRNLRISRLRSRFPRFRIHPVLCSDADSRGARFSARSVRRHDRAHYDAAFFR